MNPRTVTSALLLVLAAPALYTSTTLAWGGAEAPDGTRYKVSPVGLSHVLEPRQTVSPVETCRWSPPGGDRDLCRVPPGGQGAFARLRAVQPLIRAGVFLAVVGAALALVVGAPLTLRLLPILGVMLLTHAALGLFAASAGPALLVLRDLEVGAGGTRATMQLGAAVALALVSLAIQVAGGARVLTREPPAPSRTMAIASVLAWVTGAMQLGITLTVDLPRLADRGVPLQVVAANAVFGVLLLVAGHGLKRRRTLGGVLVTGVVAGSLFLQLATGTLIGVVSGLGLVTLALVLTAWQELGTVRPPAWPPARLPA